MCIVPLLLVPNRVPSSFDVIAEEDGFEPPLPFSKTVFKTAAINHSATPLNRNGYLQLPTPEHDLPWYASDAW